MIRIHALQKEKVEVLGIIWTQLYISVFFFLWARPHLVPENRPGSRPKKRGNSVTTKVGSWNIGLEVVQNQRVPSVKHGLTFPVYRWSIDAEMALLTRAECCRGDSVSSTALRCNLQGSIPCCMRTYQHCLDQQPSKAIM